MGYLHQLRNEPRHDCTVVACNICISVLHWGNKMHMYMYYLNLLAHLAVIAFKRMLAL